MVGCVMRQGILPGGTRRNIGAIYNFIRARSANVREENTYVHMGENWDENLNRGDAGCMRKREKVWFSSEVGHVAEQNEAKLCGYLLFCVHEEDKREQSGARVQIGQKWDGMEI